eukprot:COSAG02_NODE_64762_length_259_cov_1.293750_1_plen_46_part_01
MCLARQEHDARIPAPTTADKPITFTAQLDTGLVVILFADNCSLLAL